MDLGLVGLSMRGVVTGTSFTVSSNRQALGGAVPPSQQGPQDVKPSENTENKKNMVRIAVEGRSGVQASPDSHTDNPHSRKP